MCEDGDTKVVRDAFCLYATWVEVRAGGVADDEHITRAEGMETV